MHLRNGMLSLVFFTAIVLSAACSKPEPPKQAAPPSPAVSAIEEGKALFEQKCSVCHGLDRATARSETKEQWDAIIQAMQSKKADWISNADADKILEYLSTEHGKK